MKEIYNISFHDIYIDICNRSIFMFTQIGFTGEDLKVLRTSVPELLRLELDKNLMPYFNLSMKEWAALGLTYEHLIYPLHIDQDFIVYKLKWFSGEEKYVINQQSFKNIFGTSLEKLPSSEGYY